MKGGRIFVALLLAAGLLGTLVNGAAIYSRLLYLGVLLIGGCWLWTRISLRGLSVTRLARSLRANVGDVFEEHFEVTNAKRLFCLWVEVANESLLPAASGSRLLTGIGGRQKRSYAARSWLTRRGGYELGPTVLTSGDPFGLFQEQKRFPAAESLVVLPMLVNITLFPSPPGLLPGGKVIRRKSLDITPHASGVREYVPGDPMKRIHWPTTVRRQQLMVKEFEQDPQAEVWLFLDAQAKVQVEQAYQLPEEQFDGWLLGKRPKFTLPPSTLEYSICITASLAHYFIQQKRAVGLATVGQAQTVIPAERSVRQEDKILEALAFLQAQGSLSLASLVTAQAGQLPQGSSAILITPSPQSEILLAVDDLQRRNLHPLVVLLMADSFGGFKGGEALAKSLLERNAPVCQVYCGADLAQTLSGFAANTPYYQETSGWFRPVLTHLT